MHENTIRKLYSRNDEKAAALLSTLFSQQGTLPSFNLAVTSNARVFCRHEVVVVPDTINEIN